MSESAVVYVLLAGMAGIAFLVHAFVNSAVDNLEERMMSEIQDVIDAITAQIGKATTEIVDRANALQDRIAEFSDEVANAVAPDLSALKAAVQTLDDLNPDPAPPAE